MSAAPSRDAWSRLFLARPPAEPAVARGVFLVSPEGFSISAESAADNTYMDAAGVADPERALRQHRGLQAALSQQGIPTVCFSGHPDTPDAVYPNNVFATARDAAGGRLIIGSMRHPVRRREAERADMVGFFRHVLGYRVHDLRAAPGVSELTGTLVIDRARRLGFAGLSTRCDREGVASMREAFGLAQVIEFPLHPREYHTNVVMSVLASRALVIAPEGLSEPADASALIDLYAGAAVELDAAEHAAFAGNCIAVRPDQVWMSARAADALRPSTRAGIEHLGFAIHAVPLDAIEAGGGSLRCCVGEIY